MPGRTLSGCPWQKAGGLMGLCAQVGLTPSGCARNGLGVITIMYFLTDVFLDNKQ